MYKEGLGFMVGKVFGIGRRQLEQGRRGEIRLGRKADFAQKREVANEDM